MVITLTLKNKIIQPLTEINITIKASDHEDVWVTTKISPCILTFQTEGSWVTNFTVR
jgi:hypothetical protein